MHLLKNKDGFALVTALMFTLLSLMLTLTLLYMVTASVQTSSSLKKYHTATEAAHGGVEILIKDIINNSIMNAATMPLGGTAFSSAMAASYPGFDINANCLQRKLTLPTSQWGAACSDVSLGATEANHDLKFVLNSDAGTPGFNVYAKIVDTMGYTYTDYTPSGQVVTTTTAGNTDLSQVQLEGGGVTSPAASTNPSQPHMYRIEVQASKPNSTETSKVSVQYAY
jgi:Tfp pilus assembly protein PilX